MESRVQQYLAKKKLAEKIKEENLPVMYVVSSSSKGVEPIREIQVANIHKNAGEIIRGANLNRSMFDRYTFSEFEEFPFTYIEFNIEHGATSAFNTDFNGGGHFGSLDKIEAEKYFKEETIRIKEKYNPDLKDEKFYWVKPYEDSVWEIGRYCNDTDTIHLTNGAFFKQKHLFVIDIFPIEKNNHRTIVIQ